MSPEELRSRAKAGDGVWLDELSSDLLEKAGYEQFVMLVPKEFDARLSMLGDLLAQMCSNARIDDEKLRIELRSVSAAMSYLINSSSYADRKLHDYDSIAMDQKLRRNQQTKRKHTS